MMREKDMKDMIRRHEKEMANAQLKKNQDYHDKSVYKGKPKFLNVYTVGIIIAFILIGIIAYYGH